MSVWGRRFQRLEEEEEEEKTLVNRFLRLTPDLAYCSTGGELYTQTTLRPSSCCIVDIVYNRSGLTQPPSSFDLSCFCLCSCCLLTRDLYSCIGASQICTQLPLNHIRLFQIDSRKTSSKFDPKTNSSYRQKWMFFVIFSKSCQYFSRWPQGSRNPQIFLKIC